MATEIDLLREQNQRLERSNGELQNFAHVAAHELQEPLRAVQSFVALVSEKNGSQLNQEANEWLREATAGTVRMRELIHSLLTFSAADSQELVTREVSCGGALQAALVDLKLALDETHAQILVESELPTVQADAVLLSMLFRNLIGNSMKYCSCEPIIKIRAFSEGTQFVFEITDNGVGFDIKYADKLFQPFSRLHSKVDYPGTGLGLALCKKIVERHRGEIWVHHADSTGATFRFFLPNPSKQLRT